jgi:HAD superfamily hydrolase (TIGR01549 family)
MAQIEAVIFDADGTILDTRELISQAFKHILTEHGYEVPPYEAFIPFGGRPTHETYERFAPQHDSRLLADMHKAFQMERMDLFSAYEGFEDLMESLKARAIKIGICTNRRGNVIDLLRHLDAHHHFDAIVHADMMENLKPHPEGILKACAMMRVSPSGSVMVGDTDADMGAGKAAGCALTIGVTHGIGTREILEQHGADHIINHLDDILPLLSGV